MKYKRLSQEELQALEKEFVSYLASAQITASDWQRMKIKEPEKANELIDVFSDVVYDKVLRKIKFLEFREQKVLNIFHFEEQKIVLIGLKANEVSTIDLTSSDPQKQLDQTDLKGIKIFKTEKEYIKEREEEIFELLQNGCLVTNERLFNLLSDMAK